MNTDKPTLLEFYRRGSERHGFGFKGAVVFILFVGFMPGGLVFFLYSGVREGRWAWLVLPPLLAFIGALAFSIYVTVYAQRKQRIVDRFLKSLDHPLSPPYAQLKLEEELVSQIKWNPDAKAAWEKHIKGRA